MYYSNREKVKAQINLVYQYFYLDSILTFLSQFGFINQLCFLLGFFFKQLVETSIHAVVFFRRKKTGPTKHSCKYIFLS